MTGQRRSLFVKYFASLFVAVAVPVLAGGVSEAWFGYRDQRARLDELLQAEARLAADRMQDFVDGIREALGWTTQLAWENGQETQHQVDAQRLMRQVPAIASITLVDGAGRERVYLSRLSLNRIGGGVDLSRDEAVAGARRDGTWYGPVTFKQGSEPYMRLAVTGNRAAVGIAIAEVNLKLIWDVVSAIKIGDTGHAYAFDGQGRLIAHPDLGLVLRGDAPQPAFRAIAQRARDGHPEPTIMTDAAGDRVVTAAAPIKGTDWTVFVEQPLREAFAPIRAALWRAAALIVAGTALAAALAYALARRMARPIRALETGAQRIGSGQFDHRIRIDSGDELQGLAESFNDMADELAVSREKTERINRLKRFLAPQVAELVERSGDDRLLDGQRRDIVALFADLRGFTAFSAKAAPETVMAVLSEFHTAVGAIVNRHGATLTSFSGDGFMALVNAPVLSANPAKDALGLATDMRAAVRALVVQWRQRGHDIGFGIGMAMGPATIGRIGYEGRLDYTAIGNAVNLASRLCAAAADGQILLDATLASALEGETPIEAVGPIAIKGYAEQVLVFNVSGAAARSHDIAAG